MSPLVERTGETIADASNRSRDELRRFMMLFDVVWSLSKVSAMFRKKKNNKRNQFPFDEVAVL